MPLTLGLRHTLDRTQSSDWTCIVRLFIIHLSLHMYVLIISSKDDEAGVLILHCSGLSSAGAHLYISQDTVQSSRGFACSQHCTQSTRSDLHLQSLHLLLPEPHLHCAHLNCVHCEKTDCHAPDGKGIGVADANWGHGMLQP